MYNNSGMNNNCSSNYNLKPQDCNSNCQGDALELEAIDNMEYDLAQIQNTANQLQSYKNVLEQTSIVSKDLNKTNVLYLSFQDGIQDITLANYQYNLALNQILNAYSCCKNNVGAISSDCQTYIDNVSKIKQDILNTQATIADQFTAKQAAIIASGTLTGVVSTDLYGISEPLSLAFIAQQEELGYQSKSYTLKTDGFACCKNNKGGCINCNCYDPTNPLCQCDEIMNQSQAYRMQAERANLLVASQEDIVIQQATKLISDLSAARDASNKVYTTMQQLIDLERKVSSMYSQCIEQAKLAYSCCSNYDSQCNSTGNTYTSYQYGNYTYNDYRSCGEQCSPNCDGFITKADELIGKANDLLALANQKFASTINTINSRQQLESDYMKLYSIAIDGIYSSFGDLGNLASDIYENVLCKLDEAYKCCKSAN